MLFHVGVGNTDRALFIKRHSNDFYHAGVIYVADFQAGVEIVDNVRVTDVLWREIEKESEWVGFSTV